MKNDKETIIVKRRGHREPFDERKLYASIYAAAESAMCDEGSCENLAGVVTEEVKDWLKGKKTVDSADIRKKVVAELKTRHSDLWFFYDLHLPNLQKL